MSDIDKKLADASKKANAEVQGWAGAVPVLKWALVGVAGLIALVFIAYAVG